MKIASWNVNSIRRRLEIVTSWIERHQPDVLLLQETKVEDDKFPQVPFRALGYDLALHGQSGGRNGVAIVARSPIEDVRLGLDPDAAPSQARYLEALVDGVRVASVYVPNGTTVGSENFAFKLDFLARLEHRLARVVEDEETSCIGGDYNVAPEAIDLYDPDGCAGGICYHPDERRLYRGLLHLGLYDAFRALHPNARRYSWWDLRGGAFERDEGMRIDHLLLSPQALDRLVAADMDGSTRSGGGVSDHVPVWCTLAS